MNPTAHTKLQPGPTRDLLAKASEWTRGGQPITVHEAADRTGVAFTVTRERLNHLVMLGLLEDVPTPKGNGYKITAAGSALLER